MLRVLLLLLSLPLVAPLHAQPTTRITYGQTVTGLISDETYALDYTFTGAAGDIAIVFMSTADRLDDFRNPVILVNNSAGERIVDTTDRSVVVGEVLLAFEVPAADDYTVTATRQDGPNGSDFGQFELTLVQPTPLVLDQAVQTELSNEDFGHYYLLRDITQSVELRYTLIDGDFRPAITINRIDEESDLADVVTLTGEGLVAGQVNVPRDDDLYIVAVTEALFDFSFSEIEAFYEIELIPLTDSK